MPEKINPYAREQAKQELSELQQKIARLEARSNRQPDEDEHLHQLIQQYEQLSTNLEDKDINLAA